MSTNPSFGWVPPQNLDEFRNQFDTDAETLFQQIASVINRYKKERDDCCIQLTGCHDHINQLEEHNTKLNLDLNIARAGHISTTQAATRDTSVATSNFRSEKFPDPEKFNGKRANLPGFITQLRMKLEVNHDRFRNEVAKVIYSVSRLEGKALDQVVPLVNANPSATFSSVDEFISYLESSFGDPDPRGTARRELVSLKQGKGDFASYYSQFLRIMAYLDYNESAKIDALTEGISDELKDALMFRTELPKQLSPFAATLMTIDNQIRGRRADKAIRSITNYCNLPEVPQQSSFLPGVLAPMDL